MFEKKAILSKDSSGKKLVSAQHYMAEIETDKIYNFKKKEFPQVEKTSTLLLTHHTLDSPSHYIMDPKNAPLNTLTHLTRLDHAPNHFSSSNVKHSFKTYETVAENMFLEPKLFVSVSSIVINAAFTYFLSIELEDRKMGQSQVYLSTSHREHGPHIALPQHTQNHIKKIASDVADLKLKVEDRASAENWSDTQINRFKIALQHRIFLDLKSANVEKFSINFIDKSTNQYEDLLDHKLPEKFTRELKTHHFDAFLNKIKE